MDWQLIATAPKDGTRVLLYFPTLRESVHFGWFADSKTISHGKVTNEWQKWMIEGQFINLRPLSAEAEPKPEMWAPIVLPAKEEPLPAAQRFRNLLSLCAGEVGAKWILEEMEKAKISVEADPIRQEAMPLSEIPDK